MTRVPFREQAAVKAAAVAQQRSLLPQHVRTFLRCSALGAHAWAECCWVSVLPRGTPPPSAFGKGLGLAAIGVHGQGETEAQSGNFPTPEACEHKVTHKSRLVTERRAAAAVLVSSSSCLCEGDCSVPNGKFAWRQIRPASSLNTERM